MAKLRTYNVTVRPSYERDGMICTAYSLFRDDPHAVVRFTVAASTFDVLDAAIERELDGMVLNEANTRGEDDATQYINIDVDVPRGERKPPGFDKRYGSYGTFKSSRPRPECIKTPEAAQS